MGLYSLRKAGQWRGVLAGTVMMLGACGDDAGGSGGGDQDASTEGDGDNGDGDQNNTGDGDTGDGGDGDRGDGDAGDGDSGDGDTGNTGPVEGTIKLEPVDKATGANVANLVGVYQGTLGIWAPTDGKPARYSDSCTITVAADGTLTVKAVEGEIAAQLDGESLDVIASPNRDQLGRAASAFRSDVNQSNTVSVNVLRGYLTSATAVTKTLENQPLNQVNCIVQNPNPRKVGDGAGVTGDDLSYGGATAVDLNRAFVGTYSNGTCSVSIGDDGTLHFVKGAVDVSARLAGDAGDKYAVFPSSTELEAGERLTGGITQTVQLKMFKDVWTASVDTSNTETNERVSIAFSDCAELVKQ